MEMDEKNTKLRTYSDGNRLSLGTDDGIINSNSTFAALLSRVSSRGYDDNNDPLIELGNSCNAWVVSCSTSTNVESSTTTTTTTTAFDTSIKYYVDRCLTEHDIDTQLDNNKERYENSDSSSIISESILDPFFNIARKQVDAESSSSPQSSQVSTATPSTHSDINTRTMTASPTSDDNKWERR